MMTYLTVLLSMYMLLPGSYGYMGGAPADRCDSMQPNHGVSAQGGATSYTVVPSTSTYDCGGTITVTLSGANFKGFLCEARTDVNSYATAIGTLTDTDGAVTTANNCDVAAALTHTENSDKSSFQFTWTHSGTSISDVYIVCTVVQVQATYWEQVSSTAITYSGSLSACPSSSRHIIPSVFLVCACVILNMMKRFMQ